MGFSIDKGELLARCPNMQEILENVYRIFANKFK